VAAQGDLQIDDGARRDPRAFCGPREKLAVIYNPVDGERFQPALRAERQRTLELHRIAADATVFLVICRSLSRCAVAVAMEALAAVPPPAHLVVVCHARDASRINAAARAHGVVDRVTIVDSRVDVRPYHGAADVLVSPSIYEPAPDFALEAMACALPVIGSTNRASPSCSSSMSADSRSRRPTRQRSRRTCARCRTRRCARASAPMRDARCCRSRPAATTLALVLLYRDLLAATVPAGAPRTAMPGA
jgi:UDP-glucose:(heptosyl)LPS alpha-1,3-glucosyltransferase